MNTTANLGKAPVRTLVLQLAIPSMTAQFVNVLYSIIDRMYIGHISENGALALAGAGICGPIVTLLTSFGTLVGIGGSITMGIRMGEKNHKKAEQVLANSFLMLSVFSVLLTVSFLLLKDKLLMLFGASGATFPFANTYLTIYTTGTFFALMATGLNYFINCQGFPLVGMFTVLIGAGCNILSDPIFIFGFHMGIAGAAWATVIGQIVSGIMVILYLRKFKTVDLTLKRLKPHPHYIGRIVSLGMAPFFNQVSMMVVQIVMNNVLIRYGAKSSYGSDIPLACAGIITKINMIFFSINIGISQGLQPIISYNYGAKKLDRVREAYLKAAISATIISTVSFICFQLFPRQIIGIFGSESEAYFRFAEKFFRIFLFCTFINGLQPITANFFTAIGKANRGIFLSLTRQVIFLLPLMIILPIFFGIEGVMFSAPIADGFAAVCAITFAVKELKSFQKL